MTVTTSRAPRPVADVRWRAADPGRWLVGPQPVHAPSLRLLCVPHAGGAPSAFRPWAPLLPPDVELLVAQLPGRESRFAEPALEQVAPVVDGLLAALLAQPTLPTVLFGHSMGALIAWELAQALQARGAAAPSLLVVSGHGCPLNPEHYADLLDTRDDSFIDEVSRRYGGIPAPILADRSLLQFFLPLLRADFRLVASHRAGPRPPLDCSLLVLGGRDDPHADAAKLRQWSTCTRGAFAMRQFDGDHFYLAHQAGAVLDTVWAALPARPSALPLHSEAA